MTLFPVALSAEPASILYIVTGAVGFAYARVRKSRKPASSLEVASIPMLFCHSTARRLLQDIVLL